jgi:hypothetical protein
MRTLSAMVAALSLGACAAQPQGPAQADLAAQIRGEFGAGAQSCADRFPTSSEQDRLAQAKCFNANSVAHSKRSAQTAETRTTQRIVSVHQVVYHNLAAAPPSKLDGAHETVALAAGVPTLNFEESCHLAPDNLAVDQNTDRCLAAESSARDQLAHRWTEFPSGDRSHCMRYSSTGGGGTYTDLLTCLEMELHVRNLHAKNRSVANQ